MRERARENNYNTDERRRVCRFVSGKTESAHKRRKGNKTKKKRISAQFILDHTHTHTHTHKGYSIHHEHATYIHKKKKKKTLKNIY